MDLSAITALLDEVWLGNPVRAWLVAAGVATTGFVALLLVKRLVLDRVARLAQRTSTRWDDLLVDALRRTGSWFLLLLALSAGLLWLETPSRFRDVAAAAVRLALVLQAGFWVSAGIRYWVRDFRERRLEEDPAAVTSVDAMGFVGRLVLWALVLLLALQNAGIEIGPLLAGLGVGGVAVALALQSILGDLFASLSIVLDKPFVVGDFLVLDGEYLGAVEHIGLKTTRVRSLSGEQLVLSNSELLRSRIRNFGRMVERRVLFFLSVVYSTSREQLGRIPDRIRAAIESQPEVRFDRAHFKEFGDSGLLFEVVYYVLSPNYNAYMDRQQAINLAIVEAFEADGVEFAFPTRTLHLASSGVAVSSDA